MGRLVDDQRLDLVEHRRVRLIAVAAIDAARRDDADRRLLRQHGADLHRAGVGAQHEREPSGLRLEIERIVLLARGMLLGDVQLGEIVVVGLDVRAFGDGEAQIGEDRGDLVPDLAERMNAALGLGAGVHRQGDVGALGFEPLGERSVLKRRLALRRARRSTRSFSALTAWPKLAPLLRRQLAERFQQSGNAAVLAQRTDAQVFELSQIGGLLDAREQIGFKLIKIALRCRRYRIHEPLQCDLIGRAPTPV